MNKLEVREICFNIISKTGKAMDSIDKSLSLAKNDNFEDAKELLEDANKTIIEAHNFQTELLNSEAREEKIEFGPLLIHAQDHLMFSQLYLKITKELVSLYEKNKYRNN
ncbi:PTS lactose/cellobiose transporter subunit IIA [Anaerococcus murdochii]|uniref:PTS lactose/cellobiose transporter subunit IIA n=1 Tax=Anaerococcus murdochii TaxID=411577 RepID=A0ABS7SZI0_9FIRM|nr:PTS lactose/cellobiose transporter subunit IIA [Anaerococcus murdochii]MBZ2386944.1 PTS lactose/cellobiose transporter subunit IIA [Anaerococcus murdochii]